MHQTWPNCNAKLQKQFARLLKFLKQASNNMAIECRKFIASNPLIQVFILNENQTKTQFNHLISSTLRRGRDSNPRYGCPYNGFRDRPDRPLWHLSARGVGPYRPVERGRIDDGRLLCQCPSRTRARSYIVEA